MALFSIYLLTFRRLAYFLLEGRVSHTALSLYNLTKDLHGVSAAFYLCYVALNKLKLHGCIRFLFFCVFMYTLNFFVYI